MPEQDLITAGIEVIKENLTSSTNIPLSSIRELSRLMIDEDKLGDNPWLKTQIVSEMQNIKTKRGTARSQGYYPFINLGMKGFRHIRDTYDHWILPVMSDKLGDPEDVFTPWAIQFAEAMHALGKNSCLAASSLYKFVTTSQEWEDAKPAAEEFARLNKAKPKKKKKPADAQPALPVQQLQPTPAGQPLPAKMEITLKINAMPEAGVTSKQARFFILQVGDKKISITVKGKVFKKLTDAQENFPEWIAAISGEMGAISGDTITLEKPSIQVFERKPKVAKPKPAETST